MSNEIQSATSRAYLPVFAMLFIACGDDTSMPDPTETTGSLLPDAGLSSAERESLSYMREEEKLARDVYQALQGQAPLFANIIASEERHMRAIQTLLERYGLPDPAAGRDYGEFQNPDLQQLYGQLVAAGMMSTDAALRVGVEIEELDLNDLEDALSKVSHFDIATVYENLAWASSNHLRAFYAMLVARGGTYQPQHLTEAEFAAAIAGDWEPGTSTP